MPGVAAGNGEHCWKICSLFTSNIEDDDANQLLECVCVCVCVCIYALQIFHMTTFLSERSGQPVADRRRIL